MTIINTLNASGVAKVIAGEEKPASFPAVYPAPEGYDGWSKMTIEAPDNLTADNIRKDVEIAGVTGTYEGGGGIEFGNDGSVTSPTILTADMFEGTTSLKDYCFQRWVNLTSVTLPEGVTSLGTYCFNDCTSLASITIPDGVTSLGDDCFNNCTSLASITIPDGVTSLGVRCFGDCHALSSITIPGSVTSLSHECFGACWKLTNITIPEGVTSLASNCFYFCSGLTSITIPEGVTSLGYGCFSYCRVLASVTMLPTTPPTLGSYAFTNTSSDLVITVPKGCLDAYKSATNWSAYADKMVEASE